MWVRLGPLYARGIPPCCVRAAAGALAIVAIFFPFPLSDDTVDYLTASPAEVLVFASARKVTAILFSTLGTHSRKRNLKTRRQRTQRNRGTTSPHGGEIRSGVMVPRESQ